MAKAVQATVKKTHKVQLGIFEIAWLFAPVVMFLSYQPLIQLGKDSTTNFELSIAVLYVVVLAVISACVAAPAIKQLIRYRSVWVVTAFVGFAGASIVWADNSVRAILTTGLIGSMYLVFLGAVAARQRLKALLPLLAKSLVVTSAVMAFLTFLQFFVGIWLSYGQGLLCAGCVADQFGFVRPNLFAIEPQFLGSLFLPSTLLLTAYALQAKRKWFVWAMLALIVGALLLTLSRGAVFAFAVGVIFLAVVYRRSYQRIIAVIGVLIGVFALVVTLQGVAAVMNPRIEESFQGAVAKSVNQLSMGLVTLPSGKQSKTAPTPVKSDEPTKEAPVFNGYVEESTTIRVKLSDLALKTWQTATPLPMMIGVGLGGAGVAMHQAFPDKIDAHQIVQNEYVETLLELGLIGFVLFVAVLIGLLLVTRRNYLWSWAIIGAFLVQWMSFSGYPNALHIYLVFVVLAAISVRPIQRRVA